MLEDLILYSGPFVYAKFTLSKETFFSGFKSLDVNHDRIRPTIGVREILYPHLWSVSHPTTFLLLALLRLAQAGDAKARRQEGWLGLGACLLPQHPYHNHG